MNPLIVQLPSRSPLDALSLAQGIRRASLRQAFESSDSRHQTLLRLTEVRKSRSANIAGKLGLGMTDPSRMNADDAARLMNYARTEHPEALKKTVEEKPWFVRGQSTNPDWSDFNSPTFGLESLP
jgi:hypothetical protein